MSKKQFLLPTEKELFFSILFICRQVLFFAVQNRMPSVMLAQE